MYKRAFKSFIFNFNAPLHISDVRQDYGSSAKMIHSDAIYAAVISVLARTGQLPLEVEQTGDLGCTISSLFPFTRINNEVVYFFPRPMKQVRFDFGNIHSEKKIKKVKWLDKNLFETVINSRLNAVVALPETAIHSDFMCVNKVIPGSMIYTQTVPRASVARSPEENNGDTRIFYMERIHFDSNSGLFLMAEGDTKLLEKGLMLLQHEGIGTDRNVGQGTFTLEANLNIELTLPEITTYVTTLGLTYPEETQLSKLTEAETVGHTPVPRWDLIERGGWVTTDGFSGIRKMSVFMFTEGSLLFTDQHGVQTPGKVNIDLKPNDPGDGLILPEHPIWRCGRSLALPVIC